MFDWITTSIPLPVMTVTGDPTFDLFFSLVFFMGTASWFVNLSTGLVFKRG